MKLLVILLCLPLLVQSQNCQPKGDATSTTIIAADLQKNRSYCPSKELAHGYDISILLKDAIRDTGLIYVDAFITSVKVSGPESCECHIDDPNFKDYHIYIAATNTKDGKQNQIVEVSRYSRQLNHSINFAYVKSLVGHKVRIYGYTFMDQEHKSAIGNWRAGIEEIHPVFYIEKLN